MTDVVVSTHSRPKAAGALALQGTVLKTFQHTAARRRLEVVSIARNALQSVSTHSRPKAAGKLMIESQKIQQVSTHSRPKAAGAQFRGPSLLTIVSTHSRPKAAGLYLMFFIYF